MYQLEAFSLSPIVQGHWGLNGQYVESGYDLGAEIEGIWVRCLFHLYNPVKQEEEKERDLRQRPPALNPFMPRETH